MEAASPTSQSIVDQSRVTESARALLSGLIDYAGLFPPAALSMQAAVENYDAYLRGPHRWMLGRFIVPATRLEEFGKTLFALPTAVTSSGMDWRLSVLLGSDAAADLAHTYWFDDEKAHLGKRRRVVIESVEVKAASVGEIARLATTIPAQFETYFEISPVNARESIVAIAESGRRAKIRTGGETSEKFPTPETLFDFIELCSKLNVPFKATAGLHHPIRSLHRLTYQPDSPSEIMHGFLNVFLAAAFVRAGMEKRLAVELVKEQAAAFHFESDAVEWRGHRLSLGDLTDSRQRFSVSFGSCSFTEPIDDLRALHLL